jgi:hypothetical protein
MTRAEAAVTRIRREQEPPERSYVRSGLVETQHADALRTFGDLTADGRAVVELAERIANMTGAYRRAR